jgi:hypothetical protein
MRSRQHRAKTPEEIHIERINNIVYEIYRRAIQAAEQTDDSRYIYKLPRGESTRHESTRHESTHYESLGTDFYKTHITEIITGVRTLFPDCFVDHTTITMVCTRDGKRYDVSKISMNIIPGITKPIPCIRRSAESDEYIVVDWS